MVMFSLSLQAETNTKQRSINKHIVHLKVTLSKNKMNEPGIELTS